MPLVKDNPFVCYVIHYSPLKNRRTALLPHLNNLPCEWVTESSLDLKKVPWRHCEDVFGVPKRKIAKDLGINSRSLAKSRRKARLEGLFFEYTSFLGSRFDNVAFGSLPTFRKLPAQILEVSAMHLLATSNFLKSKSEWGVFLEDDAIPCYSSFETIEKIAQRRSRKPIWINLNSGAGLKRTNSDPQPDKEGLFRVKPPATRCATAYMVNKEYVKILTKLITEQGFPDWLPIDIIYQVANRRMKAISFWSDPPLFSQGSEDGSYESALHKLR